MTWQARIAHVNADLGSQKGGTQRTFVRRCVVDDTKRESFCSLN